MNVKRVDACMKFKLNALETLFFFLLFRAALKAYGGSQARGHSCQSTPQPQLHRICAAFATYTTGHSNARSLTHRASPGIEPTTPCFLVRLFSTAPQWELLETLNKDDLLIKLPL